MIYIYKSRSLPLREADSITQRLSRIIFHDSFSTDDEVSHPFATTPVTLARPEEFTAASRILKAITALVHVNKGRHGANKRPEPCLHDLGEVKMPV